MWCPAEVALEEAIKSAEVNLEVVIRASKAQIVYQNLPVVRGDAMQIRQLFQNLLANSIKYRSIAPPLINIEAQSEGEWWKISVRDNGIGIDPRITTRSFSCSGAFMPRPIRAAASA